MFKRAFKLYKELRVLVKAMVQETVKIKLATTTDQSKVKDI